jgi:hypothetical protein
MADFFGRPFDVVHRLWPCAPLVAGVGRDVVAHEGPGVARNGEQLQPAVQFVEVGHFFSGLILQFACHGEGYVWSNDAASGSLRIPAGNIKMSETSKLFAIVREKLNQHGWICGHPKHVEDLSHVIPSWCCVVVVVVVV